MPQLDGLTGAECLVVVVGLAGSVLGLLLLGEAGGDERGGEDIADGTATRLRQQLNLRLLRPEGFHLVGRHGDGGAARKDGDGGAHRLHHAHLGDLVTVEEQHLGAHGTGEGGLHLLVLDVELVEAILLDHPGVGGIAVTGIAADPAGPFAGALEHPAAGRDVGLLGHQHRDGAIVAGLRRGVGGIGELGGVGVGVGLARHQLAAGDGHGGIRHGEMVEAGRANLEFAGPDRDFFRAVPLGIGVAVHALRVVHPGQEVIGLCSDLVQKRLVVGGGGAWQVEHGVLLQPHIDLNGGALDAQCRECLRKVQLGGGVGENVNDDRTQRVTLAVGCAQFHPAGVGDLAHEVRRPVLDGRNGDLDVRLLQGAGIGGAARRDRGGHEWHGDRVAGGLQRGGIRRDSHSLVLAVFEGASIDEGVLQGYQFIGLVGGGDPDGLILDPVVSHAYRLVPAEYFQLGPCGEELVLVVDEVHPRTADIDAVDRPKVPPAIGGGLHGHIAIQQQVAVLVRENHLTADQLHHAEGDIDLVNIISRIDHQVAGTFAQEG